MDSKKFRQKFLEFFKEKGHKIIPSASLLPKDDPSLLFTNAGMSPLVPYLLGQPHPLGQRLVNSQKCVRTSDIEEVGDNIHLTFFEMLGNWSLGDYFKKEAIEWSFEFLTEKIGVSPDNLAVSVFRGDKNAPKDEESASIWFNCGIPSERLAYLGKKDNWWGPAGETGPCGPDTEIFYWSGKPPAPKKFEPQDERWVEIWNDVFMEYAKDKDGNFLPLSQKNVDTGLGLERTVAVLNGQSSVFQTDLFLPFIKRIKEKAGKEGGEITKEERIIADHIKAAVFILSEGIKPSNTERGYVLRRLIRRAIRSAKKSGLEENFLADLAEIVFNIYNWVYPELVKSRETIISELQKEAKIFGDALKEGMKELNKMLTGDIGGKDAFYLYQSFGFPLELTEEIARESGFNVDKQGFKREMEKHKSRSQSGSNGAFKAGLADNSQKTIAYHTATHLLHSALRKVLGESVEQRGSNITAERLRFDFSFPRKLSQEEIKKIEDLINKKIEENLVVEKKEIPKEKALKSGALSFFKEKYPDIVSVYTIYNPKTGEVFSKEICGGPHKKSIGDLGKLSVTKEKSSSEGVRRIKAILLK